MNASPGDAPPAEAPLVTRAHDGRRLAVAAANGAARALGLRPGMPLAHAQAIVPRLEVAEADPAGDAAALGALAAWAIRYAPFTAPDPPDGVWIDVTGCAHLHGGEAAMLADILRRLGQGGIAARAAVADTPGAAWALARYGGAPTAIVPPGGGWRRRSRPCRWRRCGCRMRSWRGCAGLAWTASAGWPPRRAGHWSGASGRQWSGAWIGRSAMRRSRSRPCHRRRRWRPP